MTDSPTTDSSTTDSPGGPPAAAPSKPPKNGRRPPARPLHPWLFGLYPVCFLASQNVLYINSRDVLFPAALALALTALAVPFFRAVMKDAEKAALGASTFLAFFFLYYQARNALARLAPPLAGEHLFPWLYCALFALAFALIGRWRGPLAVANRALNLVAVCLLAFPAYALALLVLAEARATRDWSRAPAWRTVAGPGTGSPAGPGTGSPAGPGTGSPATGPATGPARRVRPNIYYVILDGYPSSRALRRLWGYDNTPFERALGRLGFRVDPGSHSNYDKTLFSLSSSLNMDYIDPRRCFTRPDNFEWLKRMLEDNAVMHLLKREGYGYVRTVGMWPTDTPWAADTVYADFRTPRGVGDNDFFFNLLKGTALRPVIGPDSPLSNRHRKRLHVLGSLEALRRAHGAPSPHFAFVHILIPHPYYSFTPEGRPQSEGASGRQGTLDDIRYINRRIEPILRTLAGESPPPVIIVQGDHGYREAEPGAKGPGSRALPFANLNALRLPGVGPGELRPGMTPVNTFRVVMNHYFGYRFPLLPDRQVWIDGGEPGEELK